MKRKTPMIAALLLMLLGLTFCAKQKEPSAPETVQQDILGLGQEEKALSIFYPAQAEQKRTLSESEIHSRYQTVVGKLAPAEEAETRSGMSLDDFKDQVLTRISEDTQIQEILAEFKQNGVYFVIGGSENEPDSRYGASAHKALTENGTMKLVEKYLSSFPEKDLWTPFINEIGGIDNFKQNVEKEDSEDIVFKLHQQFKIYFGLLGSVTLSQSETADAVTAAHFWNPDGGWNAGNTNIWTYLLPLFKKKIRDKLDAWIEADEEIYRMIIKRIRPEYGVAILKNPPSAYYKALCFWYGWKWLRWKNGSTINEEFKPGIKDLVKTNPSLAAVYLAHVVHLLQDMSIPAHVHNDPHGPSGMGGKDSWENKIVNDFMTNVAFEETYQFKIANNEVADFKKFSSKNPDYSIPLAQNGLLYEKLESLKANVENIMGLYGLFFNTAQATQLFPAVKSGRIVSKWGNNDFSNGTYTLGTLNGLSASDNYNDYHNFTNYEPFNDLYQIKNSTSAPKQYPTYFSGTYYLVYVGDQSAMPAIDSSFIVISDGMVQVKDQDPRFRLYFLGYPFNKMAENLIPLSIAGTAQLIRNYRWLTR